MKRYDKFQKYVTEKRRTFGEAYKKAHKLWNEDSTEDMEEFNKIEDDNLKYLYFH